MYWKVPRMVLVSVKGRCSVGTSDEPVLPKPGLVSFASPKSSSFAPDFVRMRFPGFRSRWTTPWRCALSRASAISIPETQSLFERKWPFLQALGERVALEVLHDDVIDTILATDVVERANMRMTQAGNGAGLSLEALPALGVVGEVLGKNLDGDEPAESRVLGFVDLSHAAPAEDGQDPVGTHAGSSV